MANDKQLAGCELTKPRNFAVVPAAGLSRRMGEDKLLLPWGTSTVIESLLAAWEASGVDEIVVVTRQDQAELRSLCEGTTLVTPAIAPPQMKDSVLAALDYLRATRAPSDRDAWLLAPADMPQLDPAVVKQIIAAHDPATPTIIVPTNDGKRGHPVLFPWAFASLVASLGASEGVNTLVERLPARELECNVTTIHGDLDTPEDYQRLCREPDY